MADGHAFVANDYELRRDAGRLQIITGPNSAFSSFPLRCAAGRRADPRVRGNQLGIRACANCVLPYW